MLARITCLLSSALLLIAFVVSFQPKVASAQSQLSVQATLNCGHPGSSFLGFPTWYKYLNDDAKHPGTCIVNSFQDAVLIIVAIVEILMRLAGILAIAYLIWGGIKYIISQGEPEALKGAKDTITNAIVGLVITILAIGIMQFIGKSIGS